MGDEVLAKFMAPIIPDVGQLHDSHIYLHSNERKSFACISTLSDLMNASISVFNNVVDDAWCQKQL